ncbi:helix-turn-helix domain-containing protein [Marinagarivorans algicola]|uniref:helix-turn-helix domain-containing protein n=1 Tax=Marinagarivorans algicola TaxID=1513270 RepID=UPI0006B653EE|nr:helix-turn-helix domain-containing protein [Marinagarivorans algicola]
MQTIKSTPVKYDARKLSNSEQALLRQMAVERVLAGEPVTAVTRAYGLGDKTLYKWLRTYKNKGPQALAQTAKQGRRRQLTEEQLLQVIDWLIAAPGYNWSRAQLLQKIGAEFGVTCSATTLGRLMASCGLRAPQFSGPYSCYIAGCWIQQDDTLMKSVVRRKKAERVSLIPVVLNEPSGREHWQGWAAFGARGGVMLFPQSNFLSALVSLNNTGSSYVVLADSVLLGTDDWLSQIASLKNITLMLVAQPAQALEVAAPSVEDAVLEVFAEEI